MSTAKEYVKISNHDFNHTKIDDGLYRLKLLNKLDNFSPLLLSMAISPKMKDTYLLEVIGLLEVYAIRIYSFGGRKANTGVSVFNELAYSVTQDSLNFTEIKRRIKELASSYSNNRDFKKIIANDIAYGKIDSDALKYFLYEYEKSKITISKTTNSLLPIGEFMQNKSYSIEHIYPQEPTPGEKGLTNTHCLGNLVLTRSNSVLSNKNFEGKKKIFSNSELIIEREIANLDSWTDKSIIARGKEMAKFANERWKI